MSDDTPPCAPTAPPRTERPPAELRRILRLLVGLVLALMIGGTVSVLAHLRTVALEEAAASTQGLARLFDDHLGRTLSVSDSILQRMVRIGEAHAAGEMSSLQVRAELLALRETLPERGELLMADADGHVVAATAPTPAQAVTLADRNWFRTLAGGTEMVVGPLITGRYSGNLIFSLNRRIAGRDGRFLGVVSVGIDAAFFTDFYNSLALGQGGYVASANFDGEVVLRQPHPERHVGRTVKTGTVLDAARRAPSGTVRAVLPLDGVERVVSFRVLSRFGILVNAGMSIDEVLAPWRHAALLLGLALAAACMGVLGLALLAFRGIRREEAMMDGLEAAVRERTVEAEQRAEEARQANDSKTRFLAAASHDLRQPLQAAGMFAEVLATRLDSPADLKVVDKLRQCIEATNSLLTSLLDVSTLEAGRVTPTVSTFAVLPLLRGLAEQIEPEASARGLSVRVAATSATIRTDPVLLERLLRNLVVNAVHHTRSGGILLGCRHRAGDLVLQIWDTGIGIPADMHRAIFDDFVRGDAAAPGGGLGLGLGVVRRMAALLGLRLELRSRPGRGSCFAVVAPNAGRPPRSEL
ncbi:ATP-binding protein [Magnetospirillum sp. SS-4]|uniref:sensor histidine kinase n=1 Tax=Magnetospirillum sp. SS-4 TaxID=2681465 RepID=UPI00137D207D|nr:ATP-binding protein [Magnetospirillum sp. SS-4]CAA7614421.1 C4-dicarboxylate transport sensor protein dctB [Magnetospirillum sp. SS-4]